MTRALYEAATDAGPWQRKRGIPVYGIRPYRASETDLENMHGIDERVSITGLNDGTAMVERILRDVATGWTRPRRARRLQGRSASCSSGRTPR